VGLKPHRIVAVENSEIDESTIVDTSKTKIRDNQPRNADKQTTEFETVIDEYFLEIQKSVGEICALITSVTEFDLPIPVHVLIKLASRLSFLRWSDYTKKISGSLSRKYVYTRSSRLIEDSLSLFKWISIVLGTNSIPFQHHINQQSLNILEWTRESNLRVQDLATHLNLRSKVFLNITLMIETLSTNINLEPNQLKTLVEVEIIDNLSDVMKQHSSTKRDGSSSISLTNGTGTTGSKSTHNPTSHSMPNDIKLLSDKDLEVKEDYATQALILLERIFVVYADFLEAPIEQKLKSFVVCTCLGIYRDFERNGLGLVVRRQLIRILETIANRPYATSTTELSWHIFEMAERMESDAEIKFIARRSIKVGLAHRPTIVSNYSVYNTHAQKLLELTNGANNVPDQLQDETNPGAQPSLEVDGQEKDNLICFDEQGEDESVPKEDDKMEDVGVGVEKRDVQPSPPATTKINGIGSAEGEQEKSEERDKGDLAVGEKATGDSRDDESRHEEQPEERPEDDPQVQSYLCLFVDKPAS